MVDDGTVEINSTSVTVNSDADAVALASKVDDFITRFDGVMTAWVPAPPDGGAALQVLYKSVFGHTPPAPPLNPQPTGSTKVKIDA
jgi:hypothetical protein